MDDFIERQYQTVLAEKAMQKNSILFLPTGSGKTFISIMVLKEIFNLLEPDFFSGGKRAFFLVNTVALVDQQAKVLERHLLLDKVGRYSGDMNLDGWDKCVWQEEFCKFQVMVMTAEILNQLLLKKYISLSNIALMILDECHHAVEDHPMRQIMRLFIDCDPKDQPKVIGLTATLLNGTPKSLPRVTDDVKKLEVTLHSTVATVDDWGIVQQFSTKPKEVFRTYRCIMDLVLENFIDQKVNEAYEFTKNFSFVTQDSAPVKRVEGFVPFFSKKGNDIPNLLRQISKQLGWLGPYGCSKTLEAIWVTLRLQQQKMEDKSSIAMINSIICLLVSLSRYLQSHMKEDKLPESLKAYRFSSPKVLTLVDMLKTHYENCKTGPEEMQALIFVEEKMTAKILCSVLKNIAEKSAEFSFIKTGFMVGGSYNPFNETWEGAFNKHINDQIVERFRNHEINVLVCTDVLEEGIDIPACNLVVRFDIAKSFRSYVQSKGRARHDTSLFCLMSSAQELGNYRDKIHYFREIYARLEELLVGHTDTRVAPSDRELNDLYESEIEPYYTPLGSKVTMTSSISLVNNYCLSFAHDRFCRVSPSWYKKGSAPRIEVAIQLPKLSPMQTMVKGVPMPTLKHAKRAAALEICKMLHQAGELNDNLLPNTKYLEESDMNELLPLWESEDKASKAVTGTHKKTRLYHLKAPVCFENCKPNENEVVYLHLLEICPAYDPPKSDPRKLVIHSVLMEQRSFAILSSKPLSQVCQFPVFSKFGAMNVKINNNAALITLKEHQLSLITEYHYNLFTTMIPLGKSYLVFSRDSFLIAPTKFDSRGSVLLDFDAMQVKVDTKESLGNLEKCIVTPIHRGVSVLHEAYFVTRVCHELTSRSKFPNLSYSTYEDYFQRHHKFKICKPSLPLLEVQPFKVISNDLIPRYGKAESTSSDVTYFPQEVCRILATDGCLFLKAMLLPSVLHRLERMLVADDLRRVICQGILIGGENLTSDKCELWKTTYKTIKEEVKNVVHDIFEVKITSPLKKVKLSTKLWGDLEEPLDIEHNFESVTLEDIKKYGEFANKKTSLANSPFRQNIQRSECRLPPLLQGEGLIKLLNEKNIGPHACTVLEAITAASADDYWNLERLETLGDSFLKFAVSFMLFRRFPDFTEGKLTTIKGQILGNRNLFYCAKAKDLGQYLKVNKVVPSEGWIPPSFGVPNVIFEEGLSAHMKHLLLSKEEQYNNIVEDSTLTELKNKVLSFAIAPTISDQTNQQNSNQMISDKTVADSVESLIGAYLEKTGPKAALTFLEWMRVIPFGTGAALKISNQNVTTHPAPVSNRELSKGVYQCLGYKFNDVSLLKEATTHASSTSISNTYERLEFVGDAVLDFLITAHIYENCGRLTPGELTDLRSALVNNITFACISVRYQFYKFLNAGSIALLGAIDRFAKFQEDRKHVIDEEVLILLEEHETRLAETVDVPKALGDVFEALIGAVFLDCGRNLSVVWKVIYRLLKTEISTFSKKVPKQVVRQLYECVGEKNMNFRVSESTKDQQMEQVHVVLTIRSNEGEMHFDGFGVNKTQAKKSAAKLALRRLKFGK
ncbi:Endoribonuclease Dicer [Frankliniella fusca]|uniref:Endoribonuclease Dicer n=1 Tax=Frankliniella fusca TaxID=407009 RepID=A0AAE1GPZ9_9NEOP|nr:Endoribonuclease Dicer [Frankliniella fusca]